MITLGRLPVDLTLYAILMIAIGNREGTFTVAEKNQSAAATSAATAERILRVCIFRYT